MPVRDGSWALFGNGTREITYTAQNACEQLGQRAMTRRSESGWAVSTMLDSIVSLWHVVTAHRARLRAGGWVRSVFAVREGQACASRELWCLQKVAWQPGHWIGKKSRSPHRWASQRRPMSGRFMWCN